MRGGRCSHGHPCMGGGLQRPHQPQCRQVGLLQGDCKTRPDKKPVSPPSPMDPTDDPASTRGSIWCSSSALTTPRWKAPSEPPPLQGKIARWGHEECGECVQGPRVEGAPKAAAAARCKRNLASGQTDDGCDAVTVMQGRLQANTHVSHLSSSAVRLKTAGRHGAHVHRTSRT